MFSPNIQQLMQLGVGLQPPPRDPMMGPVPPEEELANLGQMRQSGMGTEQPGNGLPAPPNSSPGLVEPGGRNMLQKLLPFLAPAAGLGMAALGKSDNLQAFGAGLAGGSVNSLVDQHIYNRDKQHEQSQYQLKNLDGLISKLRQLDDSSDPRQHHAQTVVQDYDNVLASGKLDGKNIQRLLAAANSVGPIETMAEEARSKREMGEYQQKLEIANKLSPKVIWVPDPDPNHPGQSIPVNPNTYYRSATGTDQKPVVRQVMGPNGQPIWAKLSPEGSFEPIPGGAISVRNRQMVYTDPIDGTQTAVDIPASFSGSGMGGGQAQSAPPPPAASTSNMLPPPPAAPTYDVTGATQPKPKGVSLGMKPPTVPGDIQSQVSGLVNNYRQFADVGEKLRTVDLHGPILGRVTLAEIDKLGGMGVAPEVLDLANKIHRLTATQAFEQGGKQLTNTELAVYTKYVPQLTDTLQNALIKAKNATEFLKNAYATRMVGMPEPIRRQFPQTLDQALGETSRFGGSGNTSRKQGKDGNWYEKVNGQWHLAQ